MNAPIPPLDILRLADAEAVLANIASQLRIGRVIPYLGPKLTALSAPSVPTSYEALAEFLGTKVALPKRAKGNPWASAQHIESTRHRATVTALLREAFAAPVEPGPLHRYLAALDLPMIVDSWYDGAMRTALARATNWGEVQGITRAGIGEDRWYRFYDANGVETDKAGAERWTTLLYKPHGGIAPAGNFLITDADYVEVLTEIDIQTPIPDIVRDRRTERSFFFIGCRFHDQLLRIYARQIIKRSSGPHYAVVEPETLTKNEHRFLASEEIIPIALPLPRAIEVLTSA
ncbi:SIR2 family protein [Methylovirgula ligni]|uniref:SIR2-like protein n=1 Tax=Methylovirgula ligni TaxID=569860 RepID=A0A3D9ZBR1_9HYPH|nr:SIR2 family protein [Methylovirgula ligni]QAY95723.1 SIR2 family protein [Methylovirgula ligni]REF88906.1 SIR2-like protein [Methylovirgula ligni]